MPQRQVRMIRSSLVRLYGTPAQLANAFLNKDLPGYLRSELQARRADALLAIGDTAHAL